MTKIFNIKTIKLYLLIFFLTLATICTHFLFTNNFNSNIRYLNDFSEREVYFKRGEWWPLKKAPYTEVFCEYPPLATFIFAIPHTILQITTSTYTVQDYAFVFSLLMFFFLFLTIIVSYKVIDYNKSYVLMLLLPASLYFTYNRFDIIPAFFSILSFYYLKKQKFHSATIALAIGVLSKWYLLILFPIYANYYYHQKGKFPWKILLTFAFTGLLGAIPVLISSGIDGILIPLKFHMKRGSNTESLFYLIRIFHPIAYAIFFILQFIAIPMSLFSKIDSIKKVVTWSIFAIVSFILFAKFASPQWILWLIPFLIINAETKNDILFIILFDLTTYLYFPISYDLHNKLIFLLVIILKTILYAYLFFTFAKEIIKDCKFKKLKFLHQSYNKDNNLFF